MLITYRQIFLTSWLDGRKECEALVLCYVTRSYTIEMVPNRKPVGVNKIIVAPHWINVAE